MKEANVTLTLILMLCLISCKPLGMMIAKNTGQFIEPVNETTESIISYCRVNKVNYDKLFVVKSEDQFSYFIGKYKDIPTVFIFDKNMSLISTAVKTDCPWAMLNLLNDTSRMTKMINDSAQYFEILKSFNLIDNNTLNEKADFYILCTWAKYTPKLTKSLFETINKQKQENKLNVCHILLNVDLQESWDKK